MFDRLATALVFISLGIIIISEYSKTLALGLSIATLR